jgi:prolipoprotein diacylglyceryl transferase
MTMDDFVWNVDPVFLRLGPVHLRYYGICFALTIILGYYLFEWQMARRGYARDVSARFLLYAVVGLTVGARLGHCFFYHPRLYLRHPLEIARVWQGGLASHGATIGLLLAAVVYSRRGHVPFLVLMDGTAYAAAVGAILIRIGNFFNSEIIGRETSVPWGVRFLRRDALLRHPSQIYEALGGLCILGVLLALQRNRLSKTPGFIAGIFFVVYFAFRFIVEFVKEYQVFHRGLTMGQYLSIPFLLLGAAILVRVLVGIWERGPEHP